jgi:hypothetical protein
MGPSGIVLRENGLNEIARVIDFGIVLTTVTASLWQAVYADSKLINAPASGAEGLYAPLARMDPL